MKKPFYTLLFKIFQIFVCIIFCVFAQIKYEYLLTLLILSRKDNVWVGHLLSGYSVPMEDPNQSKGETNGEIGGTWRESIKAAYEATESAFPGGEILAHLDHK